MIMPKLFYKQYLRLSPFWRAYQQKKQLPPQTFLMNFKLLSSWIILEKNKAPSHILQAFQNISKQSYDLDRETIYRACAFLGMQLPAQIKRKQQNDLYFTALTDFGMDKTKSMALVRQFIRKCQDNTADDLDLLMISEIEHTKQTLISLCHLEKLEWTMKAHINFQRQILRIIKDSKQGWTDINNLKSVLKLWQSFEYLKYETEESKVLLNFSELLSEKIAQQNFDKIKTARQMLKKARQKNNEISSEIKNNQNAEILVKQYCIYLNWLCTRILVSNTVEEFTKNFQEFLNLFMFEFENTAMVEQKKFIYLTLIKLELIQLLVGALMKSEMKIVSLISNEYNKKDQDKKSFKNRNFFEDLKRLHKKWEEKCEKIFKNEKINTVQCLGILLQITDSLNSQLLRSKASVSIQKMMQKPIIILSNQQLQTGKILTQILDMKAHHQKIVKFMQPQKNSLKEQDSEKITSANQIKNKFVAAVFHGESIDKLEGMSVLFPIKNDLEGRKEELQKIRNFFCLS